MEQIRGIGYPLEPSPGTSGRLPVDVFSEPPLSLGDALRCAPVGVACFRSSGRFLFVNDRLCALLGYRRDELHERCWTDITLREDPLPSDASVGQESGAATDCRRQERFLVRRDGSVIRAQVSVSPVRGPEGKIEYFVAAIDEMLEDPLREQSPSESEERLRVALDASATATFRWDIQNNLVEWDENLERLFGREPSGKKSTVWSSEELAEAIHPDDLPRMVEAWWLCATEGAQLDAEYRVVWPDSSIHWVRCKGRTLANTAGAPLFLTGACTDVTQQKHAEELIRTQEERFRTLANAIPQLAWMTDAHGRIEWYNQRWYDYTGTTFDQVRGWRWQRLHHPDHVTRVVRDIRRSFRTGEPWEDTFPLRGRDGSYRWFLSRALPIHSRDGKIVGWFGTNTDITELRDAEAALRESESKLRRIAESGLIGIFYWTQAGAITDANEAFCRMLGWSQDEVRAGAVDWRSITPAEWESVARAKDAELLARGFVPPWEKEFRAKDGRRIPVLVGSALLDRHSDRGVAICLDISRIKEAEAERERVLDLERKARTDAERASRLRDEVLGVVVHDLRNPVHTILMAAEVMLDLPLPAEQRDRHLTVIRRAAKDMNRLIADLLDTTRIDSGTLALELGTVHVEQLFDDMLGLFFSQAQAADISLSLDIAPNLPPLRGDHERLVQVLSNLIGNALKFTSAGGTIVLHACRPTESPSVRISVEDSGCGIPPEALPHVFDRFWQANRTSRAGAGLGLAIARGIIVSHGGAIWVESTVGRGTTFHFTVPIAGAEPRSRQANLSGASAADAFWDTKRG